MKTKIHMQLCKNFVSAYLFNKYRRCSIGEGTIIFISDQIHDEWFLRFHLETNELANRFEECDWYIVGLELPLHDFNYYLEWGWEEMKGK